MSKLRKPDFAVVNNFAAPTRYFFDFEKALNFALELATKHVNQPVVLVDFDLCLHKTVICTSEDK